MTAPIAVVTPVVQMQGVAFRRDGNEILRDIDWTIEPDQSWIVLGQNGCGKTTLARIASLYEHPSSGTLCLLGEELGSFDVRKQRRSLSFVSSALAELIRPALTAEEVVVCAKNAALEPWWHTYTSEDFAKARSLLDDQGVGGHAKQVFGKLSSGERQRVLLARALMVDPALLTLDEPNAGLDLRGREELVERLDGVNAAPDSPAIVLVTHHVEEIPSSFTHLLALRDGMVLSSGVLAETLTDELLSECFEIPVRLIQHKGSRGLRWSVQPRD